MAKAAVKTARLKTEKPAGDTGAASGLEAVFEALRPVFATHEAACVVLHDEPGKYYLGTHEVRAKDGYRTWFGGVEIKKQYVSAHLIPVYAYPDLLDDVPAELRQRMQGKSCFNFKQVDAQLLEAFARLVDASACRFQMDGRL